MMPEPILLSVRQVAALLGVSVRTVYQRVSKGELPPPIRIGRSVRWHRPTLERFLEDQQKRMAS